MKDADVRKQAAENARFAVGHYFLKLIEVIAMLRVCSLKLGVLGLRPKMREVFSLCGSCYCAVSLRAH